MVRRHGGQSRCRHCGSLRRKWGRVPQALTDYIKNRKGYDYNEHGQAGNSHTDFVPDEIIDRFCIIGPPDEQIRRLQELKDLGVDQFALYLQHDDKDHTLAEYGEKSYPCSQRETSGKRLIMSNTRERISRGGISLLWALAGIVLIAIMWELTKNPGDTH